VASGEAAAYNRRVASCGREFVGIIRPPFFPDEEFKMTAAYRKVPVASMRINSSKYYVRSKEHGRFK
jgi:hypothetical protein